MKTKIALLAVVLLSACKFNDEPKEVTPVDTNKHETIIPLAMPDSNAIELHTPTEAKQGEAKTN